MSCLSIQCKSCDWLDGIYGSESQAGIDAGPYYEAIKSCFKIFQDALKYEWYIENAQKGQKQSS